MALQFWARTKDFLRRIFRREVAPGYFESDAKFSWHGWLATAPSVWPRREYLVYVPRGWSRWRRAPLLVLLHGCKQTPEEFAAATRIAARADAEGWLVLLPRQKSAANPWCCWNWFDSRTVGGVGEAAIIAAQIKTVAAHYRADPRRVFVAGLSAGGAFAAVIGLRHAGLVRGVIVHSGLACGAAATPVTALDVMKRGPNTDVEALAADARRRLPGDALPVPLLALHGEQDGVVAPRNAVALVRQYLRLNGHPAVDSPGAPAAELPAADATSRHVDPGGRVVKTHDWRVGGRLVVRLVEIGGLGHAWSGGDPHYAYSDAHPPDATALIATFAREAPGS